MSEPRRPWSRLRRVLRLHAALTTTWKPAMTENEINGVPRPHDDQQHAEKLQDVGLYVTPAGAKWLADWERYDWDRRGLERDGVDVEFAVQQRWGNLG